MCATLTEDESGPRLESMACRRSPASCPATNVVCMLRNAGFRPTRQRIDLARLLYGKGNRHITAEALHEESMLAGIDVSLATVYNTLNQLTDVGLLREIVIDSSRKFFDTNIADHYHFYVDGENEPRDIERAHTDLVALPEPPEGTEVVRVDIVVRLRPCQVG